MRILVTGGAGFIGSHLIADLQNDGFLTMGLDNYNDILYDPSMKEDRVAFMDIGVQRVDMTHFPSLDDAFSIVKPNIVIHLGALAGVRDSFGKERDYIKNNIDATQNLIDCCKMYNVSRVLYASSSSVYAGSPLPFREDCVTGDQLNPYAYTKRCNEMMFKSSGLDTVGMRFFTVYGDWGRPDMALFKFTKGIINKKKIDIYNNGRMYRDFTFIDDIVNGITALINKAPNLNQLGKIRNDSLSPVAPFRILNIGNTKKVFLLDFIKELEKQLGKKAIRNYMSMQKGDVKITVSNTSLLKKITKYNPKTHYKTGIKKFLEWYLFYYKIKK